MALTHRTAYRVIYGDTDSMGIVYYANYLRWFEVGRTELIRSWGMPYRQIEEAGFFLPVAEVGCRYLQPARYDDLVMIEATLDPGLRGGLKIDYRILSQDEQSLHATGFSRHAFLNREGRVIRPPAFIRALIRNQGAAG